MLSTLTTVIPIFALILAGWLVRRFGVLGPQAMPELNRFVVYLALPALLFNVVVHTSWSTVWRPGFILAFGIGSFGVFALTVLLRLRRQPLADAAIDGLDAGYANVGFMGFPLALVALGPDSLPLTTISAIITVCVVFAVAILLIEAGLHAESSPLRLAKKIAMSLLRNPLLISPALGALIPVFGLHIPQSGETFLKLLGSAASPCALVVIGLFIAEQGETSVGGQGLLGGSTVGLVAAKLLGQPLLTWVIADLVVHLPVSEVRSAVLLAALPTGTGPFMLAEFYKRPASTTSNTILVSTVLSIITVSAYLALSG